MTEIISYAHSDKRGEYSKHPVADRVSEYFLHGFVTMVSGSQAITMTNVKAFAIQLQGFGIKIDRDIQFLLKVLAHPHIMVANKEMNSYTCICEFRYLS